VFKFEGSRFILSKRMALDDGGPGGPSGFKIKKDIPSGLGPLALSFCQVPKYVGKCPPLIQQLKYSPNRGVQTNENQREGYTIFDRI
jgi:hypothetical protein